MVQPRCLQGTFCSADMRSWPQLQPKARLRMCSCSRGVRSMAVASDAAVRRFAVLGGGFAGVSVAWHLLQQTSEASPICVELYDEGGIGAGASGVSGGLLHPYTPKGKLLWKGAEGFAASLRLLDIAECYVAGSMGSQSSSRVGPSATSEPLAWKRGIMRPLLRDKHAAQVFKVLNHGGNFDHGINCINSSAVKELVPGLQLPTEDGIAMHIPCGVTLHPKRYLEALWMACEIFAQNATIAGCAGTQALLHETNIHNLLSLSGSFEAVVVCLGAKSCLLPELVGKLPLSFCRGVVADMQLQATFKEEHKRDTPSVLADTWLAVQGPRNMMMGATKEWGCSNLASHVSLEEGNAALDVLLRKTRFFYPLISRWEVLQMRAGVRAMPPRTQLGALPIAGCIDKWVIYPSNSTENIDSLGVESVVGNRRTKFWLLGGLGARGLVYHALLGEQVAKSMVAANDAHIFTELRQWCETNAQERLLCSQ